MIEKEEENHFTGTDGKRYIQFARLSDNYVLAVENTMFRQITPAPAIICMRSKVKEAIENDG